MLQAVCNEKGVLLIACTVSPHENTHAKLGIAGPHRVGGWMDAVSDGTPLIPV